MRVSNYACSVTRCYDVESWCSVRMNYVKKNRVARRQKSSKRCRHVNEVIWIESCIVMELFIVLYAHALHVASVVSLYGKRVS